MIDTYNDFIKRFKEIKAMGYVSSFWKDSLGVGRTFEQLLGIKGNCIELPDYNGIEIKTKASLLYSDVSLFNCTPIGNAPHELERLKNKYGYPDKDYKKYKVLYSSANCVSKNKVGIFYKFQIMVDKPHGKIVLLVYNLRDELIDDSTFWPLDLIEARFLGKCRLLAFVHAKRLYEYGDVCFYYDNLKIMKLRCFDKFVELLEKGLITIDFKIGIFKTAEKLGMICDHGTAFKIDERDLDKLYDVVYDSKNDDILEPRA